MTNLYKQRYRCTPRGKYNDHKVNAGNRDVEFKLTFDEWWSIWKRSKRWSRRGWRPGQYVMCRRGDCGAYEVGNVYIALADHNLKGARYRSALVRYGRNWREIVPLQPSETMTPAYT